MKRVLEAIGFCLPDIGYCQGMNFIASTLLGVLEDEELAFWIFMNLLVKRDMRTLFLPVRLYIELYLDYREYLSFILRTFKWHSSLNFTCQSYLII
jgi:hypothetical protein